MTTKRGKEKPKKARILVYDLESSPNIMYSWGKYEQNALGDFIKERQIICFAWKWLGEKKVHVLALPDFRGYQKNPDDNRKLILKLHDLISEADIVVAHNGDKFDNKMINVDFIKHGLKPPSPYKSIDTLKAARSKFRFNSNKLDDLGKFLKVGKKLAHTGFSLWEGCMRGDKKCWSLMKRYNLQDVTLLEKVYLKLRPWIKNHPNHNDYTEKTNCPKCQGKLKKQGTRIGAGGSKRQSFQCLKCGSWCSATIRGKIK